MIKSKYPALLNALCDMQQSPAYALRRATLEEAEQTIVDLEARLAKALDVRSLEKIAEVGVDSGQLLLVDPCYIKSHWTDKEFVDTRQYRHKDTGAVLQYRKDFPHYEAVIPAYEKTMNQLNATREWTLVEQPKPEGINYAACCHTTLSRAGAGQVDVGAAFTTGYGDGQYPVYVRRDEDGRIMQAIVDFSGEEDEDDGE